MSSKNVLPSSAASELENSLKTTISDWLQNIRLSQHRYIASNLEAYGVCFVEDFECLKKEEFVSALSNSDSSMRVIEVRRATAEFLKVHDHFEQKHSLPSNRVSSSASNFSISHITIPKKGLRYLKQPHSNRGKDTGSQDQEIISIQGSSSSKECNLVVHGDESRTADLKRSCMNLMSDFDDESISDSKSSSIEVFCSNSNARDETNFQIKLLSSAILSTSLTLLILETMHQHCLLTPPLSLCLK